VGGVVAWPVPDVGEVHHRLVIVPVVTVRSVITRAVRALQVGLPRLVCRVDQIANIGGADRVQRVFFLGVVQRDAEGATAGYREVVTVARVFFGVELGEHTPLLQQGSVRCLLDVPDDLVVILVLEVGQEDMLVTRNLRRRRRERRRLADRRRDGQAEIRGDSRRPCRQRPTLTRWPGGSAPAFRRAAGRPGRRHAGTARLSSWQPLLIAAI